MASPKNEFIRAMLTDLYQITMAYAYFRDGRHELDSVFELFYRKNPFHGEFTIVAGTEAVLEHLCDSFCFNDEEVDFVRKNLFPGDCEIDEAFFDWLRSVDASKVTVHCIREGTVVAPRTPLIRVSGPLGIVQLLETTMLNLVNFPSLIATNAARFRLVAGADKRLLEFGLRRAQGPDGAMCASRYSYIGGFDGTSNCLAGMTMGLEVSGTHAHAFVTSYSSLDELSTKALGKRDADFVQRVLDCRAKLAEKLDDSSFLSANEGELAAFISYAQAFPTKFLCLVDSYDTLRSGVPNFLACAAALAELGVEAKGIRLDSGDLAFLSQQTRRLFQRAGDALGHDFFGQMNIVASNDLTCDTIISLNTQNHEIDTFGVGTNLVTCKEQPALGCVFKLVEINGKARIKLSQERGKTTLPGLKKLHRLILKNGEAAVDLMSRPEEPAPAVGEEIICVHPEDDRLFVKVRPSKVIDLLDLAWADGKRVTPAHSPTESREYCRAQLAMFRSDHLRMLNPSQYKVSVSRELFSFYHHLIRQESTVATLE